MIIPDYWLIIHFDKIIQDYWLIFCHNIFIFSIQEQETYDKCLKGR